MALAFPDMFYKNSVKILEGAEGTKNNLALMLKCEKGEQLGDPEFGTDLHKAKFGVNVSLATQLAIDGVVQAQTYMNNILFFRDDVSIKKSSVTTIDIEIRAIFSSALNVKDLVVIQGVNIE